MAANKNAEQVNSYMETDLFRSQTHVSCDYGEYVVFAFLPVNYLMCIN